MKVIFLILSVCFAFPFLSQVQSPDCATAENVCSNNGSLFPLSIGQGVVDIPPGNNISNPTTNPQGVNMGCLFSNELNPNWFVINIGQSGNLEFTIGQSGGSGYFDWAMWPYDPATSCNGIFNNTLPPVACNWNASAQGFTGMWNGGPPPGGIPGNFQPSLSVQAGEAYVLMFSNYSYLSGNAQLTFPSNPGSAVVTCQPGTPDQTICLGDVATVDIIPPPQFANETYNWLVTNGVSNTSAGQGVLVSPTVTTEYHVEIWDGIGTSMVVDTFTITVVDPAAPDAGPDFSVCLGDPIYLNGTISNASNTNLWLVNTSQVSPPPTVSFSPNFSSLTPTVTVNQMGTYLFILRETSAICGNAYDTVEVTVSDLAVATNVIQPSCQGLNDAEIHIDSPGAIEYSFDGGTTWQVDSFMVALAPGTYNVCGQTQSGCQKCISVDIIDPLPVTLSVSNDTTVCENGTATLIATANGGTSFQYHWDFTSNTQATQLVNPGSPTTYTVYAENQNGCTSAPLSINVGMYPPLQGSITAWDTVCPGYDTDISANVSGGIGQPYSFVWSTGASQNGPQTNMTINVSPSATTNYTVTLSDGCESTPLVLTTNVFVPLLPMPQYEILDPVQCEAAVFHIVNTTHPAYSASVYWLIDSQYVYINQDTVETPSFPAGEYGFQMIVTSFEGCVDSISVEDVMIAYPSPIASFQHSPNNVTMFNPNVYFINTSTGGYQYQWYFQDGSPAASNQESVYVHFPDEQPGEYEVILITTTEQGCIDTAWYNLIIEPEILIYAPNSFTPDDDEFNQSWRIFMEGIDIYNFELFIYNRWGELIWESHDIEVAWDGTYNGRPVSEGTYTWVLNTKDLYNDKKYTFNGHINVLR